MHSGKRHSCRSSSGCVVTTGRQREKSSWVAEVGYQEEKSSALLQQTLADEGFTVTPGVAGIPVPGVKYTDCPPGVDGREGASIVVV